MNNKYDDFKRQLEYIKKIKEKDCQKSFSFLLNEYEPLLRSYASFFSNKFPNIPMEKEDIMNELSFSFYELVKKYDEKRGKLFGSYIKEFLYFHGLTKIKVFINNKHKIMNHSYEYKNEASIIDDKSAEDTLNNFDNLIDEANLSKIELIVINGIMNGKSIKELSMEMGIKTKTLYSARTRARLKLNKINQSII